MNKLEWSDKNKEIRNKLIAKYSNDINKKIWGIREDYDVLDNYLEYRFRFLNEYSHIRYDKESYDSQGGSYFPATDAQYAAFNTGLTAKGDHLIWGVYEVNADIWNFVDFYAHGLDERKKGNILDKIPIDTEDEFYLLKDNGNRSFVTNWSTINNFYSKNLIIRSEHLLQSSNQKNRSSFLSHKLTSCFHYFQHEKKLTKSQMDDQKELIIKLIDYQLRTQGSNTMTNLGLWRWECPSDRTAKNENDFEPLSLLFPIYILTEQGEIPDLIVPITIKKRRRSVDIFEVETVLSIEEAYKCAMLVDPGFQSVWLTHDNVMKYISQKDSKKLQHL